MICPIIIHKKESIEISSVEFRMSFPSIIGSKDIRTTTWLDTDYCKRPIFCLGSCLLTILLK